MDPLDAPRAVASRHEARRELGPVAVVLRVGIGRPPGRQDPADFVLEDFRAAERKDLAFYVDRAADAVEALITDGLEPAQNRFHADLPA